MRSSALLPRPAIHARGCVCSHLCHQYVWRLRRPGLRREACRHLNQGAERILVGGLLQPLLRQLQGLQAIQVDSMLGHSARRPKHLRGKLAAGALLLLLHLQPLLLFMLIQEQLHLLLLLQGLRRARHVLLLKELLELSLLREIAEPGVSIIHIH